MANSQAVASTCTNLPVAPMLAVGLGVIASYCLPESQKWFAQLGVAVGAVGMLTCWPQQ